MVVLAALPDEEVLARYSRVGEAARPADMDALFETLGSVRHQGFSINRGLSERGVLAIGHPVKDERGTAVAAVSLAMPDSRFAPAMLRPIVTGLRRAARAIAADRAVAQELAPTASLLGDFGSEGDARS